MRHARWNYDADVAVAPVVIAIHKEAHHPPWQTRSDVAQNYLNATLQEKHHVPLLIVVPTQRIIFRLPNEQSAVPPFRRRVRRNTGRMHMETFCRVCKHPRSRPLLGPEADPRENPFVASHKFTEESAVTLWVNLSKEDFHTGDPGLLDLPLVPVRSHKFVGIHTSSRKLLCERCGVIVAGLKRILSSGVDPLPKIFFVLGHF
jgi:hypothetical protein